MLTVSAKTGKGTDTILKVAFELRETWSRRMATGELNRWFEAAIDANPPPAPKGQRIKLRYITQVNTRPPTFVVFGNRTDELPESYRRYLVNALRRDLQSCGWQMEQRAGLPPRRECLASRYDPAWPVKGLAAHEPRTPVEAIVIGAGLSGAAVAASLDRVGSKRGCRGS